MGARIGFQVLLGGSLAAATVMGGCADLLGYGDLKDRVADGGEESGSSSGSSGSSSSGGSSSTSSGSSSSGGSSSSSSGGSGSGSGAGSSGSSSSSSSSGSPGDDGGTCTPLASVPASDVVPYAPVQQVLNACLQQQITGFITACTSSTASQQTCSDWQNDPTNSDCLACILPSNGGVLTGAGAVLVNAQQGFFTSNVPGCLALVDPTNGPKCASEYEPQLQCAFYGCSGCASGAFAKCITEITTGSGACASYTIPDCSKDVFPDGGTYNNACTGPTDQATTQAVLTVICGGGA